MLDALPFAAAILNADGIVLAANPRFLAEFRLPYPTSSVVEALCDDDRPAFSSRLISALVSDDVGDTVDVRLADDEQQERWFRIGMRRLGAHLGPGQTTVLLQATDVSSLIAELNEVTDRENRWNAALVSAASGVWDHNIVTNAMSYSEVWYKIRGLTPGDPIPLSTEEWLEYLHPEDKKRIPHCIERQLAGDPDYAVFEYRERHKDGHWVWIECRGACVEWDAQGNPVRMIGTDTDVTQRKRAEEMVAQMSRRLELALETSNIGIFEADLENLSVYWDDRSMQLYGLDGPARELPNGTWQSLVHPEDLALAESHTEIAIAQGQNLTNQFRIFRRNDGAVRYLRSRATTFTDNEGRRKLIGVTWDVSEDVYLHQALDHAKKQAEAHNRELESAKARIEHIALHDHLTGLPNRRYLDEMLDKLAAECIRDGNGLAVLHIDLDRFKQINDTLGHGAGDMMLKHAAGILKSNVRARDFVARIGGDEFVFLARFDGAQQRLADLADRIINAMRQPVTFEGNDVRFGASIGIAHATGPDINARQILLNADIALYNAKNRGRNRHEFFSRDTHNRMIAAKRLSDELLCGLERGEFVPHYQFQFHARSLDLAGAETLARWHHPTRGILTPDKFLAIAEDLDVVSEIDAMILEKSLADFARWKTSGLGVPKVSVNVSSSRLHDPILRRKLASLSFEPGTLSFELLESIFLDKHDDQVLENLNHLRELGIDIEIDDFGTGHASIVSLLRLNPSTLKIDRELVQKIPVSLEQRKLVGSIIEIGHSLGIKVVAEGVETPDHVRVLQSLGCDMLQGYGLSRSMEFSATEAFIRAGSWRGAGLGGSVTAV
ncbi:EAL domain-containing protein [Rhizobium sp. RU36D]|uniref:EAL domain-containing protein n=1 Tax=Rhizobium sp. RU36D TaxID=1907415 RepID=UPI0009D79B6B|nr:EAL domain-containing protein [Rhizobium sp. RU36D]SMC81629.1 PAS domain S-box-containing protein/diguanylate cyclase (GGDEF) domain-containing protein [Rhizobium sp. RU36D]